MGPAKGSRTINKTVMKGHEDQQQYEDPPSSSKGKQKKRKISDLDPNWSKDQLRHFYEAYRRYGKDWTKISIAVGGKSSAMVKSLYSIHRTFLSLPECQATPVGFITLATGHHNALDEPTIHRRGDQTVRAYGKRRKLGDATQQRANGGPQPVQSCLEAIFSGFSSSFKKRYHGELVRDRHNHTVGKRTPRIPIIFPACRNATDDVTPEIGNIINSRKNNSEEINNGCTNFPTDECSPNGSSGITETNKVYQGPALLMTKAKGTGDAEIRRIHQTMEEGQTRKVEPEAVMEAKDGNKVVDSVNQHQILSDFISEDDMLVLDVLQSLMNAPSKSSKLKISTPSGSLGKNDYALSHRREEHHSSVDLSKQGNPVGKRSASKTTQKRHQKLLDAEEPSKEQNISVNKLVLPEAQRVGITEGSLCSDSGMETIPQSSANISAEWHRSAPTEIKLETKMSRRTKRKSKRHCKKEYVLSNEGSDNLQARKLQHCLSSELLRRWCTYEWFYSAVDYPWFSNNEFVNYLNFANFSHLSRLTRSEWSTIRSSLGKPRRFSDHFLAVERDKLDDYRVEVRKIYAQLSDGSRDSLPADLAKPFSIDQQVIVRHPSSRELCDGKVIMMRSDSYKVHFDNPDLGVGIVKDTDCMPVNWLDNRPDNMRRSYVSNKAYNILEMEHIPKLTPSEDQTINGVSVPEVPKSQHLTSDEQLKVKSTINSERPWNKFASNGTSQSRARQDNNCGLSDELETYITSFLQRSLSQARKIVDDVMQENSEGNDDEELSNQATGCIGPESEAAIHNGQRPPDLTLNCIATVLSIKNLSESRHPPANIAGVLERASLMLCPSCPENLAIYRDIENSLATVANQLLALVPTTLTNGCPAVSRM